MELSIYLGRMPIMSGDGRLFAYELLHRSTHANYTFVDHNVQATARVLVNALNYIGLDTLTEHRPAFIKVDDKVLADDLIFCVSEKNFVLEILEGSVISSDLISRVKKLHKMGYRFALNHYKLDDDFLVHFKGLIPFVKYIKIDVRRNTRSDIAAILKQLTATDAQLIAEKVEDIEDFEWAKEIGFKYFEGYYFSKPQVYVREMIDPDSKTLLELIYLLKKEAPFEEVLSIFNNSPYLSVNLLKYVHINQGDHTQKITSIDQALLLLDREKLSHWVELMIYAQDNDDYLEKENSASPLYKIARQRAALMEELSHVLPAKKEHKLSTSAYLVGILSLAEVIFQSSFEKLFEQMDLDSSISGALMQKKGGLGELLELSIFVEHNNFTEISNSLSKLGLSQGQLNEAVMRSYQRASAQ